ncbi:hypothetical protein FXF51_59935 [Nonomuraea sp. PA05]|nr:hypothetical protein FXF51_59935 [Nonomuraea sp. PA05]
MRVHRARTAPTRGASAVEWVIITAIVAVAVLGVAALFKSLVAEWMGRLENLEGGGVAEP